MSSSSAQQASGHVIAAAALQYEGIPYRFGGGSPRGWDCSGMVNWVLGRDLGMTLPGGVKNFNGATHGPVVLQYATWSGAQTVSGPPEPGDLCVWPGAGPLGHIGIAVTGNHMISALNPINGTKVTPIAGYGPPVPVIYRRITASAVTQATLTATEKQQADSSSGAGCPLTLLVMLPALPVLAVMRYRQRRRS